MKKVREARAAYGTHPEQTVALPDSVMEDLNTIVRWERMPVEEAIRRAIAHYRGELGHRKINAEAEAYRRKYPRLRAKYLGEYIAMHNGRVVDHDRELGALYKRVRKRFGKTPVLMRLVEEVVEREIVVRSPRLEPLTR
ncbi:MAG: ribbon-helix-helix protein, CopG family [Chloroflexi bacterium]|nr:ribbon-helix-helix protein, CopG family [Chloroflexota bacterium]